VAAGPSLAVFLLAAQVAQQCLVTPEKSALTFSTESVVFGQLSGDRQRIVSERREARSRLIVRITAYATANKNVV
jgi:hypothetical protein